MSARKRKATRQAHYRAGPLAPWRSITYLSNERRFRIKCGIDGPLIACEVGSIDFFRVILSPTLE